MPMVGASAGALASICSAAEVDAERARDLAIELCDVVKVWERGRLGLAGLWGDMVREWLYDLLPEDAHERCRSVRLVVTSRSEASPAFWPRAWSRDLVGDFDSVDDLVDGALASAHVPFVMDGNPQARWRDRRCIDLSLRIRRTFRRQMPNFIVLDASDDPRLKGSSVLALPSLDRSDARRWMDEVGALGIDWADEQLRPGGVLHPILARMEENP